MRPSTAAACRRQRTTTSVCCCQKFASLTPAAAPAQSALARIMAVWGCSHPLIGDQRSPPDTPLARPCGSKTPTGPRLARAVIVAARLSGRVLVVTTAPGASRMKGITRLKPLPLRGGPRITIESSTLA